VERDHRHRRRRAKHRFHGTEVVGIANKLGHVLPGIVLVVINCGWMCMLCAILCLRYRDFSQIIASVLQVMVFVTPVFWQVDQLKGNRAIIAHANPIYHLVDIVRQPLLGVMPSATNYLVCVALALAGWLAAFHLFAAKRHRLAYWF
jgi:lipopolysaccharide transport system permease protein